MRKMESIIKWSGSITCKLVKSNKRQTLHSECSLPQLSAFLFTGHESTGGKLEWMPSPIFKCDSFFLLSRTFYLHHAPLFYSHGHDGRAPRRKGGLFIPWFYWESLASFIARPYKLSHKAEQEDSQGMLSFFRAHMIPPHCRAMCYFWASPNRADESSYELTPSELLKCEKIVGDTSARCMIQYFVLSCLGVLRLRQNPLLSVSLHKWQVLIVMPSSPW